ncbi:ATP-grasp domain-containing protein [Salinicoccus halitifaciens]|uniref:D-alanine-D-alanine ligase-like ATP-grasp enzyme n=1 Tax=Salinicoccus halitifaciens TaxID=1073415 RepID=A0ABV2EDU2_9STAP|nr:ATP-grasp domain-containing protein [Salinicoccus halitifaciens]MCD2137390.1 ATP-grasp domain-containing protein [Salinicoccus halitifaciens]
MDFKHEGWLPHLIDSIPVAARKNHTSLYTIALEGWRRGLGVRFFKGDNHEIGCILTWKDREYSFIGSSGELITDDIIEICNDKGRTNEFLSKAGVPIPLGKEFGEDVADEVILGYAKQINFPLVLKPTDGRAGRGVYAGIKNEQDLKHALKAVRVNLGYKNILVQQYVTGDEVRIYVLDGRVLAASNRRPANILGDGTSTVKELIVRKNILRKKVPSLYFRPIKIDKEVHDALKNAGYTMESIPKKDERIFLRRISNLSRGGESVDITDKLTPEQRSIAIRATKAIPGLVQCGVDMIINEETGSGVILELNTRPGIGNHLFPVEGTATDIPKEILNYYIPETKAFETVHSNAYFEFDHILDTLKGDSAAEIEIRPYTGKLSAFKIIVSGENDYSLLYDEIEPIIFEQNLHGHLEPKPPQTSVLIVAGANMDILQNFIKDLKKITGNLDLTITGIEEFQNPVMTGFRMLDDGKDMSLRSLRAEIKKIEEKRSLIEKETVRINRRINLIQKSVSWKLSAPFRVLFDKIGRKRN